MNISLSIPEDADGLNLVGVVHPTVTTSPAPRTVEFSLDGALVATITSPPWVWVWDTKASANGVHKLSATAYYKTRKSTVGPLVVTVANGAFSASIAGTAKQGQTLTAVVA